MDAPRLRRPVLFLIKRPKDCVWRTKQAFVAIETVAHRRSGHLDVRGILVMLQTKRVSRRVRAVFDDASRIGDMFIRDADTNGRE